MTRRALMLLFIACASELGATPREPQDVLIIHSLDRSVPAYSTYDDVLRTYILSAAPVGSRSVYSEFMDAERFSWMHSRNLFAAYLRERYADRQLDLIVATGVQAVAFVAEHRDAIFPGVPVVFTALAESRYRELELPPDFVGVTVAETAKETFGLARILQPDLQRLYLVTGTSKWERVRARDYTRELEMLLPETALHHWSGMSLDRLRDEIARLDSDSALLLVSMLEDDEGGRYVPAGVARELSAAALVPIYSPFDVFIGSGIVGGYMARSGDIALDGARMADRVLRDGYRTIMPRVQASSRDHYVDARQLERWNLDRSALPADAVVLFDQPSVWVRYAVPIALLASALLLQLGMIALLLALKRRRRDTEMQLARTARKYQLATAAARVGVWDWNLDTDEMSIEPILKELLGYEDHEIDDHIDAWSKHVHPDDLALVELRIAEHLRGETPRFEVEHRMLHRDGGIRWFIARGEVIRDDEGRPVRMVGTDTETTERKRLEDERQQAMLEAQQRRSELAHIGRITTISELSGAMAHELSQPLTAIINNAQAVKRMRSLGNMDEQELIETLSDIEVEGRRAGDVLLRIRSLLRRDSTSIEPIDIDTVIADVLALLHSDFVTRHISVTRDIDVQGIVSDYRIVQGDRVELQQVLLNLIVNACEAMEAVEPAGRRLTIRTEQSGEDRIRVSVADTGPGVESDQVARLFEPFFTTKNNGLGIGLALCRSIIDAHGGSIWAESRPGSGTRFTFELQHAVTRGQWADRRLH